MDNNFLTNIFTNFFDYIAQILVAIISGVISHFLIQKYFSNTQSPENSARSNSNFQRIPKSSYTPSPHSNLVIENDSVRRKNALFKWRLFCILTFILMLIFGIVSVLLNYSTIPVSETSPLPGLKKLVDAFFLGLAASCKAAMVSIPIFSLTLIIINYRTFRKSSYKRFATLFNIISYLLTMISSIFLLVLFYDADYLTLTTTYTNNMATSPQTLLEFFHSLQSAVFLFQTFFVIFEIHLILKPLFVKESYSQLLEDNFRKIINKIIIILCNGLLAYYWYIVL